MPPAARRPRLRALPPRPGHGAPRHRSRPPRSSPPSPPRTAGRAQLFSAPSRGTTIRIALPRTPGQFRPKTRPTARNIPSTGAGVTGKLRHPGGTMSQVEHKTRPQTTGRRPGTLGLAAFALTMFLLSAKNAGWTHGTDALARLRRSPRRPGPAPRRDVGVPQPQCLRLDRVRQLRRLLDRPGPLRASWSPPKAGPRRVGQRPGVDPARLRDLHRVHAAVEHPGQRRRYSRCS